MRQQIRPLTAIALAFVLLFTTSAFKCGDDKTPEEQKSEFIAYAKDIHAAFVTAGPLIAQLKPNLKSKWDAGTAIAGKLIVAVEASDKVEVVALITDLIPIFTLVVDEFTDNTKVLVVLALAQIGLTFFANHYKADVSASGRPSAAARTSPVVRFASRPKWKCRDSVSGQYRKMAYCEANPSTSTVETQ